MAEKEEEMAEKMNAEGGEEIEKTEEEKKKGEMTDHLEEEYEKKDKGNPPFGVRSYLHQFYTPEPVDNPGLYEFPKRTGLEHVIYYIAIKMKSNNVTEPKAAIAINNAMVPTHGQVPSFKVPNFQVPKSQVPNSQESNSQVPNSQGSNFQGSNYQASIGSYEYPDGKRRRYSTMFIVTLTMGLVLTIVNGVVHSFQYYAPNIWAKLIKEIPELEAWTIAAFCSGIGIIIAAVVMQIVLDKIEAHGDTYGSVEEFQTSGIHEKIPIKEEIQAIQPPQESIMTSKH